MTWGEFKKIVAESCIVDSDEVRRIEIVGDQPFRVVVHSGGDISIIEGEAGL